jgi:hypothetical protein
MGGGQKIGFRMSYENKTEGWFLFFYFYPEPEILIW